MITSRFRWLFFFGAAGTLLGLLRGQEVLSLIGLSLLIWLLGEWLLFRLRFLAVSRALTCRRQVGSIDSPQGTLWAQRPVEVRLEVASRFPFTLPLIRFTDYLSEQFELVEHANHRDANLRRNSPLKIGYTVKPLAAGTVELPGVAVQMFDLHGLFFARALVPCPQRFQVLPMPVTADSPRSYMKFSSALPPPGIHRLQKAGMGGELLDLREYVPGDPPKSIAWKVSARRDCLMIRQHESEVPIRTTLLVDHSHGSRCGAFGMRPIDQLSLLAVTIARSSLAVRDPVGLTLVDEHASAVIRPSGGSRHYFRLLDRLSRAAGVPAVAPGAAADDLAEQAYAVASERYPSLMVRGVNRVRWFWFPLNPAGRYLRGKRIQLAALFTELYELPPADTVRLQFDGEAFGSFLRRFLSEHGCAVAPRIAADPESHDQKVERFTSALLEAVSRGRDNEVFVLLADLLDHAERLGRLGHAIGVAAARHHRVIVICPWPDWLGPRMPAAIAPRETPTTLYQLIYEGERLRLSEAAGVLARTLRKAGASVAFAADPKITQLVLSQADLVRAGRIAKR